MNVLAKNGGIYFVCKTEFTFTSSRRREATVLPKRNRGKSKKLLGGKEVKDEKWVE